MAPEEFEFTWEVLEISTLENRRGALVRYTPEPASGGRKECSIIEQFVPVPFHKARDKDHAREMMEKKIRSRAPTRQWMRECIDDESGDTETIADELAAELGLLGENNAAAAAGDTSADPIPESSGSEGIGSGNDGDPESEGAPDGGAAEAGRRRR